MRHEGDDGREGMVMMEGVGGKATGVRFLDANLSKENDLSTVRAGQGRRWKDGSKHKQI